MPCRMSRKNVRNADKEMFGSSGKFSPVGHNKCPYGKFFFYFLQCFFKIPVTLKYVNSERAEAENGF